MAASLHPLIELGVFSAALLLAGWATLLQRRPEPTPDWPPSPPPPPHVRRDLVVTAAGTMFVIAGVGVATLSLTVAGFLLVRMG